MISCACAFAFICASKMALFSSNETVARRINELGSIWSTSHGHGATGSPGGQGRNPNCGNSPSGIFSGMVNLLCLYGSGKNKDSRELCRRWETARAPLFISAKRCDWGLSIAVTWLTNVGDEITQLATQACGSGQGGLADVNPAKLSRSRKCHVVRLHQRAFISSEPASG